MIYIDDYNDYYSFSNASAGGGVDAYLDAVTGSHSDSWDDD